MHIRLAEICYIHTYMYTFWDVLDKDAVKLFFWGKTDCYLAKRQHLESGTLGHENTATTAFVGFLNNFACYALNTVYIEHMLCFVFKHCSHAMLCLYTLGHFSVNYNSVRECGHILEASIVKESYTVLQCAALCCIAVLRCCVALCCIVFNCVSLCYIMLQCAILCYTTVKESCCTRLAPNDNCVAQRNTMQYNCSAHGWLPMTMLPFTASS